MLRTLPLLALLLALAVSVPALAKPVRPDPVEVTTDNETPVLYDDDEGGNASGDDPAIWVHPTDSTRSIVIATAKEGGLRVYGLGSAEFQSIAADPAPRADGVDGRYNNVDIA
jgi:3-phytase